MHRWILVAWIFNGWLLADPPVAVDDAWSLDEDAPLIVGAATGLASNDSPGSATAAVVGAVSAPTHGTLVLSPDGAFAFTPAANFFGADSFTYKAFGDRPVSQFTIDQAASTLKLTATLRITFQGIPSISSDSSTSRVSGSIAAAAAPNSAPFSVIQTTDLDAVLTDPVSLKLGVGCIPIINTCVGGVQFDSPAGAISLRMDSSGPVATVRANGGFDASGSIFSVDGEGAIKGTEQLAPYLPEVALPLALPAVPMPFNGRITSSAGLARLELQINYKGTVSIDATTSLTFGLSGVLKATAPLPLLPVEESAPATVSLTVLPVNDAPLAAPDAYLVRAGTTLNVSSTGAEIAEQIILSGATWRYYHEAAAPPAAWKSWSFTDTAWASGPAELGYGDAGILGGSRTEATNIRGSAARPAAYFRREFTVTDVNSTRSLTLELLRDDGAAVYLNGIEVARQNLAPGAGHSTLAAARIPNSEETQFFPEPVQPALLLEGKNVVAVEVHQFSTTDLISLAQIDPADVSFDFKLRRVKGLTGVLANDSDIDSTGLTVSLHTPPAHGQVVLQPDGAFVFTPEPGFTGADSFIYGISDGESADAQVALIPPGSAWKYLDDGSDQGAAWQAANFSDSSWSTGTAEIGYGDDNSLDDRPETTTLSYLLSTPPVTTYFRKAFTLPLPKAMLKRLRLRLLRDDGAAVYLNGVEIVRDNLLPGAAFDSGSVLPVEGEAEAQWFDDTVPAEGLAALVEGRNVLAVELHQNAFVSNDASFDCQLIADAVPGGLVTLNVAADDFDHDQIADSWERLHSLDFAVPDGAADPDGDGETNREEFLADTDPHDPRQYLKFDSAVVAGNEIVLQVPASANRRYVLQSSPDLTAWTDISAPVVPAGPVLDFALPQPLGGPVYYRVRVDFQFP